MNFCSVVTVLVLVGLTKKRFGHYAILKDLSLRSPSWGVRSGVEMRNMCNLVNDCVPLIGGSISWPFHDIANPNLVGRYHISQKVTYFH